MNQLLSKLKINLPVRMQNIWFWIGLAGTILAAMNVSPEMFTSWQLLWQEIAALFTNPFRLGCVALAIIGVFVDPTTSGIGDSTRALSYTKLKKE